MQSVITIDPEGHPCHSGCGRAGVEGEGKEEEDGKLGFRLNRCVLCMCMLGQQELSVGRVRCSCP